MVLKVRACYVREIAMFAQFGTDLDDDTKKLLKSGNLLTELKQPQNSLYLFKILFSNICWFTRLFDNVPVL